MHANSSGLLLIKFKSIFHLFTKDRSQTCGKVYQYLADFCDLDNFHQLEFVCPSYEYHYATLPPLEYGAPLQFDSTSYFQLKSKINPFVCSFQVKDKIMKHSTPVPKLETHDYVLLSLSLISILVYSTYKIATRWKRMRTPELMMLSLLVSLFGALAAFSVANLPSGVGCRVLAAMLQFLFLSTLFWSNAIGINTTYTIFSMMPVSTNRKRYLQYCIYAIGLPLLLVIITYIFSVVYEGDQTFRVYRQDMFCFLQQTEVMYGLFLAPMYLLITANISLCIACIIKIEKGTGIASNDNDRWKKNIITCIKLSITFGISWSLLPFLSIWPENMLLATISQILIEIQGILVVAGNILRWKSVTKMKTLIKSRSASHHSAGSSNHTKSTELTNFRARSRSNTVYSKTHKGPQR